MDAKDLKSMVQKIVEQARILKDKHTNFGLPNHIENTIVIL